LVYSFQVIGFNHSIEYFHALSRMPEKNIDKKRKAFLL